MLDFNDFANSLHITRNTVLKIKINSEIIILNGASWCLGDMSHRLHVCTGPLRACELQSDQSDPSVILAQGPQGDVSASDGDS